MEPQGTPPDGGQQNPVQGNWYDEYAGEDEARIEQLSQFDSFDAFLEDYNGLKSADWRDAIAGDDPKFKSKLDRYSEPGDFGSSYREMEQKLRAGQMQPTLKEDATDEEIKEFRRQNGIPLEAEGYLKDLPEGLVIGEDDVRALYEFHGRAARGQRIPHGRARRHWLVRPVSGAAAG